MLLYLKPNKFYFKDKHVLFFQRLESVTGSLCNTVWFLRINLVKLQAQFLDYILSAVKAAFKEESHPEQQTAFSSSLV